MAKLTCSLGQVGHDLVVVELNVAAGEVATEAEIVEPGARLGHELVAAAGQLAGFDRVGGGAGKQQELQVELGRPAQVEDPHRRRPEAGVERARDQSAGGERVAFERSTGPSA